MFGIAGAMRREVRQMRQVRFEDAGGTGRGGFSKGRALVIAGGAA